MRFNDHNIANFHSKGADVSLKHYFSVIPPFKELFNDNNKNQIGYEMRSLLTL